MTDAEKILKQLNLDYEVVIKEAAYKIKPKNFLSKIYIMLVEGDEYSMFIWKDETILHECKFKEVANITDVYSFLYSYDINNLKDYNSNV